MGQMNTALYSFLSARDRFADLFNGVLFQGRQVINAEGLQPASEQYTALNNTFQRFRDIKMYLTGGEALRILAVENQNSVDYTLPYRCMEYDALEYGRQLQELKQRNRKQKLLRHPAELMCGITKQDRLTPVYTICLYHGEEIWDGPLSLRDMMYFDGKNDNFKQFFADYPMRLFCINAHENFDCFHTELREVFTAMSFRRDKAKLYAAMTENPAFQRLNSETVQILSVLLNTPKLWENRKKFINENHNREEYNMCQAMQELFEDARYDGLSQGMDLMNLLVQKLLSGNRLEDLKKAVTDTAFRDSLLKEYNLK